MGEPCWFLSSLNSVGYNKGLLVQRLKSVVKLKARTVFEGGNESWFFSFGVAQRRMNEDDEFKGIFMYRNEDILSTIFWVLQHQPKRW